MTSLEETLEGAHNALDDLWKLDEYRYPQNRMELLMDVIGKKNEFGLGFDEDHNL